VNTAWWAQGGHYGGRCYSVNYTLGYGLITILVGIYLLVYRNDFARSSARSQRRLKRWFGFEYWPGTSEGEQKFSLVLVGVVCLMLGLALIVIGGYWWMSS
jgi:predicted PurR-regulated permease PerM